MPKPVGRLTDEVPWPGQAIRAGVDCFDVPHQDGVDYSIQHHTVQTCQQVEIIAFNLREGERGGE